MNKFNNLKLNLEVLAEEAAEVIEVLMARSLARIIRIKSKVMRFGIDDYHPKNGAANKESLEEEIGHFYAMVDILVANGTIDAEAVERGRLDKIEKLPKWYTFFIPDPPAES